MQEEGYYTFAHVLREGNQVADHLVNSSLELEDTLFFNPDVYLPRQLRSNLKLDRVQ